MAYEPHEWQVGDKITSARLNNIERGILVANNLVLSVQEVDGKKTINASYDDIVGALSVGRMVFIIDDVSDSVYTFVKYVISYSYDPDPDEPKCIIEVLNSGAPNFYQRFEADSRTAPLTEFTDSGR